MKKHRRRHARRRQAGFTLIELMVSLVLFSLITAGLMSVAVTMAQGYRDQEVTIATETASRSSIDFLSEAIRGASPGVTNPANITQAHTCEVGAFSVTNDATVTGHTNTSDVLTVVMAHGSVVTSLAAAFSTGTTVTVADISQFRAGDFVLITDFNTGHLAHVASCNANATGACTGATLTIDAQGTCAVAPNYNVGATVIRALRATFYVKLLDGIPVLMMNTNNQVAGTEEPIAEGIEDMQIVLGQDANNDGVLGAESGTAGADEWLNNVAGETTAGTTVSTFTNLRAIRVNLVARTTKEAMGVNTYQLPQLEDRAAGATVDNYRRRILTSTIEIRNLGGSP